MARKKTKKEKQKTAKRKTLKTNLDPQKFVYSLSETVEDNKPGKVFAKTTSSNSTTESVLGYNPDFVITDLKKTISLSLLIFAIEIGLFIALRSGILN